MPLVTSSYRAKGLFKNAHFSTIYSAKIRQAPRLVQTRERVTLSDSDFIDLDFSFTPGGSTKIAILLHGLEGNAQRSYIKGQARVLTENSWNVCAVNYRGCSGEPNRLYKSYNAGKTDDLDEIIHYILQKDSYTEIALIGFSLGGNLLLKYLGERESVPKEIKKSIAVSAPLSLEGSLNSLTRFHNWIYRTSFLYDLRKKYVQKVKLFPELASASESKKIRSLLDFDNIYTAPAHGFKDAYDYYHKNSSGQFLEQIKIPVLLLNAENDSFLSDRCYPRELASELKNIYLETPKYGGHVGFVGPNNIYYNETRALEFLNSNH